MGKKRINGKVTDNVIKQQLRRKIWDDPEQSNYDKVERLNKLNQFGMYEDPQPQERVSETPEVEGPEVDGITGATPPPL